LVVGECDSVSAVCARVPVAARLLFGGEPPFEPDEDEEVTPVGLCAGAGRCVCLGFVVACACAGSRVRGRAAEAMGLGIGGDLSLDCGLRVDVRSAGRG
jgi:hypothetical protein